MRRMLGVLVIGTLLLGIIGAGWAELAPKASAPGTISKTRHGYPSGLGP